MFRGFFPSAKKYDAVVAGSVLVDVIARSSATDGTDQIFDASGTLDEYRIGGCAFNIFVHLSEQRARPILCSGVKKNSIFSNFIIERVREYCGNLSLMSLSEISLEPAFVCQVRDKEVYAAVTSTCVSSCDLNYDRIADIAATAVCFVMDCSLSESQINNLVRIAKERQCQVIFNGTSDGRVSILRKIAGWKVPIDLLVCNAKEYASLCGIPVDQIDSLDPEMICERAQSKVVVITFGEKGYTVFQRDERNATRYPAIAKPNDIISTVGAGDALTAAFALEVIRSCRDGRDLEPEKAFKIFSELFQVVSSVVGSTAKSESLYDHSVLPPPRGVRESYRTLWLSKHFWNRWSAPIGMFGILLTIVSLVVPFISTKVPEPVKTDVVSESKAAQQLPARTGAERRGDTVSISQGSVTTP